MFSACREYREYIIVWAALIVLTAVTFGVSYLDMGVMNAVVALSIASVKAALVALFFMHLRRETGLVWTFALFPLAFLLLIIAGTLIDVNFR